MAFKSAMAAVCQNVLVERDGVPSLIRIVDLFSVSREIVLPIDGALPPIPMSLYINIKLSCDDADPHTLEFSLERPDGESKTSTVIDKTPTPPGGIPEADRSIVVAAQLGVEPRQFGLHRFHILFDGEKVTEASFFIKQVVSEAESESN